MSENFIITALKNKESYVRLTNNDRWMVWDDDDEQWVVYERKAYARSSEVVYHDIDLDQAVAALLEEAK